ncbi:hypothetical protein BH23GEM6_BH23GEM6_24150 [soil metagenome]
MTLLVGATGLLGGMIADRLLASKQEVRILVRNGSDASALVERGARPYIGDLRHPSSLAEALDGARTVITTANSAARGGDDTVDTVEIAGNRALLIWLLTASMIAMLPRHFLRTAPAAAPRKPFG